MTIKSTDPKYLAQDILSRRDHSEWELRQKLKKKGMSGQGMEETIEWLKMKKYLSDEVFSRKYIESTLRTKAVGKRYLSFKLKEKHIAQNIVSQAVAELVSEETEKELLHQAATSWRRTHHSYKDEKIRLGRFLHSRGFSSYLVQGEVDNIG